MDYPESGPEGSIEGGKPVMIAEGEYDLVFQYHRTGYLYGRQAKIVCYFQVVTMGKYVDVVLPRYYNAKTLTSKPRKGGGFKVGWFSDFVREYCTVHGAPPRSDRISTKAYRSVIVRGRVETVKTDSRQRPIPEPLRYSTIAEILGRVQ